MGLSNFRLRAEKMFCTKIFIIIAKVSCLLEISKLFIQGVGFTCTVFPHLWTKCYVKKDNYWNRWEFWWMGNFWVRIFPGGSFPRAFISKIKWLIVLCPNHNVILRLSVKLQSLLHKSSKRLKNQKIIKLKTFIHTILKGAYLKSYISFLKKFLRCKTGL